ncbi:MAG TPA: hydrogenase formation protein HypD [Acidobacteriota bacterium]|nr:hydrogenase formation protein HypD [Acidobacteriota bacterium]
MKYLDEYRDPQAARQLVAAIRQRSTRTWRVMEICGGQTHTLIRSGIDRVLVEQVDPIHGPGCPVCVTPLEKIDRAREIALREDVILATFGDMMRVPGSKGDLLRARAQGADVRMVYSPTDALKLAADHPHKQVVFFGVGFETTAPANAMALWLARQQDIANFSVLVSHVRVPPAVEAILQDPECQVEGFIAPGHVCTIMGCGEYEELTERYGVPFVVAGFEPLDLLKGLLTLVTLLEEGRAEVVNEYGRSVRPRGNEKAQEILNQVMKVGDVPWRGLGVLPGGGLVLREEFALFDAEKRFPAIEPPTEEPSECIAAQVLQGKKKPHQCAAFGKACTPTHPLGAPMVSSEGACAAYYSYQRYEEASHAL